MTVLAIIRRYWKPLAAMLLFILWTVFVHNDGAAREDAKWSARWHQHVAEDAAQWAKQEAAHRKKQEEDAALVAVIEANGYAALQEQKREIDRLRNAVAAGNVRLRVKATCPKVPDATGPAKDSGMGDGAAAELTADARQDYFDLRAGIAHQRQQLITCQGILDGLTASPSATK